MLSRKINKYGLFLLDIIISGQDVMFKLPCYSLTPTNELCLPGGDTLVCIYRPLFRLFAYDIFRYTLRVNE